MYYLYSQKREIDESFYFHMDEDLQEVQAGIQNKSVSTTS